MKYMMDTDDVANKLKKFTVVSIIVKVRDVSVQLCFPSLRATESRHS